MQINFIISKSGINAQVPYNEKFIKLIKNIPPQNRMWVKELKAWFVTFDWEQELRNTIEICFDNPVYVVKENWN